MGVAGVVSIGGHLIEHDDRYRELFDQEFGRMHSLARLLGADDPENVAQEAFVKLHGRLAKLRDPISARAYLRTTVVNLTRSRIRHLVVARRHADTAKPTPADLQHPNAEELVLRTADQQAVLSALKTLAPKRREALVLRFWADLPVAEVAAAMGTTVGTAKSQISRALSDLRLVMEEEHE